MFHSVFTKLGSRGTAASALTWSVIAFLVNQLVELVVLVHGGRHYADLCQWDCKWYAGIVQGGYDLQPHGHGKEDAANWAFFPAFPLLAKLVSLLTGSSPELALVLASKLCFFGAIFLFVRFTASVDAAVSEPIAALTIGLSPYAIYGNVGYTEPMFLMLTCACFVALHAEKHVWAGWAGALLGATFVQAGVTGQFLAFEGGQADVVADTRALQALMQQDGAARAVGRQQARATADIYNWDGAARRFEACFAEVLGR